MRAAASSCVAPSVGLPCLSRRDGSSLQSRVSLSTLSTSAPARTARKALAASVSKEERCEFTPQSYNAWDSLGATSLRLVTKGFAVRTVLYVAEAATGGCLRAA